MAAYGFSKLINTEELQEHSLRDCSVVIDGQNYLHNLYEWSKIPFIFGSETDKYAEHLKKHFEMFKQANVKCHIVFKGGDSDIEKKIKKFQHLVFDVETNIEFIPPVLLKDINVQVVAEMGIDYAFCVTEAKDECVALAVKLECSVISRDKEFCFKKAPYIPSNTMNYDDRTKSIQCRQFKLQDFLKKNSLTVGKYAIFAVLTDTAVFPVHFFDSLFYALRVTYRNRINLRNLIVWLSKHSEEEATSVIFKHLTSEHRKKFWNHYSKIVKNMEPGHATEYLLNSNLPIVTQDPEWFEKGVVCKHVPPVYINLYKWNVIEGYWVILDKQSQDSLLISVDIVKYAYNLLTNYRGGKFKVYQDANKYIEIMPDENLCRPSYNCEVSVFENGWDEVKDLKLFEHFLTENRINTEFLVELEPNCVVLFAALVYFARKKQLEGENVTREVYAVVLSFVLLNLISNTGMQSKDWKDNLKLKHITAKFYQYDEGEARRIFNGKALQRLVELQLCIQHMNYLNTLCGSPYVPTQYRKLYNGTLVYKMIHEMRDRDVGEFVNELFETNPKVLEKVKGLTSIYHELFNKK